MLLGLRSVGGCQGRCRSRVEGKTTSVDDMAFGMLVRSFENHLNDYLKQSKGNNIVLPSPAIQPKRLSQRFMNETRVRPPTRSAFQGERVKQLATEMPAGMSGIRARDVGENVYFIVAVFMIIIDLDCHMSFVRPAPPVMVWKLSKSRTRRHEMKAVVG